MERKDKSGIRLFVPSSRAGRDNPIRSHTTSCQILLPSMWCYRVVSTDNLIPSNRLDDLRARISSPCPVLFNFVRFSSKCDCFLGVLETLALSLTHSLQTQGDSRQNFPPIIWWFFHHSDYNFIESNTGNYMLTFASNISIDNKKGNCRLYHRARRNTHTKHSTKTQEHAQSIYEIIYPVISEVKSTQ